ncbi:MAG: protein kinase domain-containing protein [Acidimicrobiales bacterium]
MAPLRIDEQVGRVLESRYRLTRLLGTGASAHVYVADDVRLRRQVAVKVLRPGLAGDRAFLRRFRAEAQVVAALRHPNIGRVYDWGEDDGAPFLVMELLVGGSLRSLLDTGYLLSPAQVLRLGIEAGSALDHAHRRGLVHRDVKPANPIFDDEGHVSVADFGRARALAESTWTEPAGAVVGTARYAAPEQVRGNALDARADVYALALVLVEAATGRVPFATDTTLGTLMARVEQPMDVGADLGPLTPVLEAAGTVHPADRLDAAGLVDALRALVDRVPPPAHLPLVDPLDAGRPERDADPTAIPGGRPVLFDMNRVPAAPPDTGNGLGPAAATAGGTLSGTLSGTPRPAPAVDPAPGHDGGDPPPRRRWRRWRRAIIVAVVVAVMGAAVDVGLALRPQPTHPVPGLRGDSEIAARQALHPLHVGLRVGSQVFDPSAPLDTVIAQRPSAGRISEDSSVTVTLSRGPRPVAVPTVAGKSLADATTALTSADLKVGVVTPATSLTILNGSVISAKPDHGTLLPGQAVDLVVSSGKPTVPVPALTGSSAGSYSGAQAALTAVGLLSSEGQQFSDAVPAGEVIGTNPGPGFPAPVGNTVVVEVSRGPDLVTVPAVGGSTVAAASAALSAAGFSVTGVSGNPTAPVSGTSPSAGSRAHRGSAVQIATR